MIILSCLIAFATFFGAIIVFRNFHNFNYAAKVYDDAQNDIRMLEDGSAYLTHCVRNVLIRHDVVWMENYFKEVDESKRRERAVEQMEKQVSSYSKEACNYLSTALEYSNFLMETEIHAMKICSIVFKFSEDRVDPRVKNDSLSEIEKNMSGEEMQKFAYFLLFDASYEEMKGEIQGELGKAIEIVNTQTLTDVEKSSSRFKKSIIVVILLFTTLFLLDILMFFFLWIYVLEPLRKNNEAISKGTPLQVAGSKEFKYMALTYNHIFELNEISRLQLEQQAEHDALTSLFNRGAYNKLCEMLKNDTKSLVLVLIDVDEFKKINDGYGHETGDQVLQMVAGLLKKYFRSNDSLIRFGGDEFAVMISGLSKDDLSAIIDKISKMNEQLSHPSVQGFPKVSLSAGVAYSEKGYSDTLLSQADKAMYEVKKNGRAGCRIYGEN